MSSDVSRRPAIAGVGQIVQRLDDPSEALEPIALMENAIRKAAEDAGLGAVADYVRGASTNRASAEALRGRLPEAEWAAAAAYLDRVGAAGSLD